MSLCSPHFLFPSFSVPSSIYHSSHKPLPTLFLRSSLLLICSFFLSLPTLLHAKKIPVIPTPAINSPSYPWVYGYYGSRINDWPVSKNITHYQELYWSAAIAIGPDGKLWFADKPHHQIMFKDPDTGFYESFAGRKGVSGFYDGSAENSLFTFPTSIVLTNESSPSVIVADWGNHVIRKISSAGITTTIAGIGQNPGFKDGPFGTNKLYFPQSITIDDWGNIYILDIGNRYVRKLTPQGFLQTLLQGSCKDISHRIVIPGIFQRLVGCYTNWIKNYGEPSVHLWDVSEMKYYCYDNAVLCAPRRHPLVLDSNGVAANYKFPIPEVPSLQFLTTKLWEDDETNRINSTLPPTPQPVYTPNSIYPDTSTSLLPASGSLGDGMYDASSSSASSSTVNGNGAERGVSIGGVKVFNMTGPQ